MNNICKLDIETIHSLVSRCLVFVLSEKEGVQGVRRGLPLLSLFIYLFIMMWPSLSSLLVVVLVVNCGTYPLPSSPLPSPHLSSFLFICSSCSGCQVGP